VLGEGPGWLVAGWLLLEVWKSRLGYWSCLVPEVVGSRAGHGYSRIRIGES